MSNNNPIGIASYAPANDSPSPGFTLPNVLAVPLSTDPPALQSLPMERWLLHSLLRLLDHPPIQFRLWDGVRIDPSGCSPRFTLFLADRKAIYQLIANPSLSFGDLYSAGRIEIEGDLIPLLKVVYEAFKSLRNGGSTLMRTLWRDQAPRSTSLRDARDNIHHHYDLGNEFYRLWLDREAMQYTCAYYAEPDMELEQAQIEKMHHVCRKLLLKPGQRVVEAGSGWGGLACFMARHYGVYVTSYNISEEQVLYARARVAELGLTDRVQFIEDDYRNIRGEFDAFVSVGMLEHVGTGNYKTLADVMARSLAPHGIGLIHTIGRNKPARMNGWIEKRIFPGAYPPSVGELMALFENSPFSVLDLENLRLHYRQTLSHWLERFEQHADRIEAMYDATFVRAWRLYLAGSIAAFQNGSLQLFQVVFAREGHNAVPISRRHLYDVSRPPQFFSEGEA